MKKKGFTLLELMIMMAIVAMVAAIVIPILIKDCREKRCQEQVINKLLNGEEVSEETIAYFEKHNITSGVIRTADLEKYLPGLEQGSPDVTCTVVFQDPTQETGTLLRLEVYVDPDNLVIDKKTRIVTIKEGRLFDNPRSPIQGEILDCYYVYYP